MNAAEMHVIIDMNAHRNAIGLTVRALAEALNKDETTVRRQINTKDGTSVSLYIAYEYAQALGGAVKFLTDEQVELLKTAKENAREIERLRAENDRLSASVAKQKGIVASQAAKIEKLETTVERKDAAIERKDAKIGELLARAGI